MPLTDLVGRSQESAGLQALLQGGTVRLVTLTGPGGVGKTRLALDVASRPGLPFDVVAFVPFAAVRDPDLVPVTITRTLGIGSSDETAASALADYLAPRTMLLILDNLEHLLAAGPGLVDLIGSADGLTVLVTSRALLRVSGEHVVTVPPLSLPEPGSLTPASQLGGYGAVRLFAERGAAIRPDFTVDERNAPDVVQICRRLDGLPLAIELAAARISVLPPDELLARLSRRLPLLTDGPRDQPDRLRAMQAGIAWSHDLLSPEEQRLFRRLAVFAGGFMLDAAESVNAETAGVLDVVSGLVDKSLVQRAVRTADGARFTMLETIREYATERLEASGEQVDAVRAHAEYFTGLAERAEPFLRGPSQQRWRDTLETELDNLRAALAWTLGDSGDPEDAETGLRLVGALWYFWFQRGLTGEARRWLTRALDSAASQGRARAQALLGAGTLAWRQGDCPTARAYLDDSVERWRDVGDPLGLAEALHVLGHVRFDQGDYAAARALFVESSDRYRSAGDTLGGLPLVGDLGLVAYHEGDYDTAERIFQDSLALYRRHGLKDRVAGALIDLGDMARLAGDDDRAGALYEESLALWRELHGTPGVASALHKLGHVSLATNGVGLARQRFAESLALQQGLGNKQGIAECLAGLAAVAAAAGGTERAAQVFAASSTLVTAIGVPLAPVDRLTLTRGMDAVRERLGPTAWESAWATGSTLSTDEVVRLALVDDGSIGVASTAEGAGSRTEPGSSVLSRRELEVGALLARGLTNREIAGALSISEKTVGSHVDHIMTKLGLRSRTLIALWAVENGLRD